MSKENHWHKEAHLTSVINRLVEHRRSLDAGYFIDKPRLLAANAKQLAKVTGFDVKDIPAIYDERK